MDSIEKVLTEEKASASNSTNIKHEKCLSNKDDNKNKIGGN